MDFADDQIDRYARHLVLPEVGEEGQAKLLKSSVLVIGAGGLGSPLLLYLAAAGVGHLGVIDDDTVDLSNLQRQVLHDTSHIGLAKVESARRRLAEVNPEVKLSGYQERLTTENALTVIEGFDIVADGSDNFATRYLVNDACFMAGKTLVSAAILRFDGQLSTFKPHERRGEDDSPCYRCLFGGQPADGKDSCADVGVMGALAGVMGSLQANEVIKEILSIGDSLSGQLILFDALAGGFHKIKVKPDPGCVLCGPQASIRALRPEAYQSASCLSG
ncbi:MAG: molybdopterin-synthase adenylyltransferase MoeB [Pseudomonadota bacterium]